MRFSCSCSCSCSCSIICSSSSSSIDNVTFLYKHEKVQTGKWQLRSFCLLKAVQTPLFYFAASTPCGPSCEPLSQSPYTSSTSDITRRRLYQKHLIHDYLCLIYVLLVISDSLQAALVSDGALRFVVLPFAIPLDVIISIIVKSSLPRSTVITNFKIVSHYFHRAFVYHHD